MSKVDEAVEKLRADLRALNGAYRRERPDMALEWVKHVERSVADLRTALEREAEWRGKAGG